MLAQSRRCLRGVQLGKYAYWSKKELDALKKLIGLGCTLKEMQTVLKGRSSEAIRLKAAKSFGHSFAKVPQEIDEEQLRALIALRKG